MIRNHKIAKLSNTLDFKNNWNCIRFIIIFESRLTSLQVSQQNLLDYFSFIILTHRSFTALIMRFLYSRFIQRSQIIFSTINKLKSNWMEFSRRKHFSTSCSTLKQNFKVKHHLDVVTWANKQFSNSLLRQQRQQQLRTWRKIKSYCSVIVVSLRLQFSIISIESLSFIVVVQYEQNFAWAVHINDI